MRKYKELLTLYKQPFTLMRLGINTDGGYIVPNELLTNNLLTCGISNEISFEEAYLQNVKNCNIHAFDGTINKFPSSSNVYNFHKVNIGATDSNTEISLNTIFEKYFHDTNSVFVKMDIEEGEYPAFSTISDKNLQKIECLVLEVHWIDTLYDKFEKLMNTLANELVLIHKHDNNNGRYFTDNNNIIPRVYELTFVNKKHILSREVSDVKLPIDNLDFVNDVHSEVKIPTC